MIIFKEINKVLARGLINCNQNRFLFAEKSNKVNDNKKEVLSEESLGNYRGMVYNMRKDAEVALKIRTDDRALFKYQKRVQDHLVELTLYM